MSDLLVAAVAGNAAGAGEATYVEDVFSTYLYTGNGVKNTVNNGIKLSTNRGVGSSVYFLDHHNIINTGTSVQAGTNNFTIEFFYKEDENSTSYAVFFEIYATGVAQQVAIQRYSNENKLIYVEDGAIKLTTTDTINAFDGDWHHHAIVRNGNTVTYYLDGTSVGTYTTSFNNNAGDKIIVGTFSAAITAYRIEGFMSNLRYVIGTAVYTSSFTPPTEDLTAISGTEVLLYQGDNPLSDNSSNSYSLTGTSPIAQNGFGPYEIDFAEAKGGLVWLKNRDATFSHTLYDTERGATKYIMSNATNAESTLSTGLTSFNANGFTHGSHMGTDDVVSWTFAKQEKFFDVVTYTGTGSAQNISHNLGSVPGMIIVKATSRTGDWMVYHSSVGATGRLRLNNTGTATTHIGYWNNTAPTDSVFTVNTDTYVNQSGATYVAYLFADNDGDGTFGESGDQDIIKTGTYTGNGSTDGTEVDLGFEPQWLLLKGKSESTSWVIVDVMRGIVTGDLDSLLFANVSNAELTGSYDLLEVTPTGFKMRGGVSGTWNGNNETYIYYAIRRGPMKTPESGTEVFAMDQLGQTSPTPPGYNSPFPVDLGIQKGTVASSWTWTTRLLDGGFLKSDSTQAYAANSQWVTDFQNGYRDTTASSTDYYAYMFRRAPGFFDVVAYDGNGVNNRQITHNLGVVPELIIIKRRDDTGNWITYIGSASSSGDVKYMLLNASSALVSDNTGDFSSLFYDTLPTSSVFTVGNASTVNRASTGTYIAYLFATLPGVSKVGSYSGNASGTGTQTIDCGFSNGARFVLIKCTSATGLWVLFDTERGITSGLDNYLNLSANDAQTTNADLDVDPDGSGFILDGDHTFINRLGREYIFLAIA